MVGKPQQLLGRQGAVCRGRGLTPPSSGHAPAGFAHLRMPLMSNVRAHMQPRPTIAASKWACAIGGAGFALAALYALMGVLQALSLFTGERALRNVNLWGSLFLVGLSVSVVLIAKATRIRFGLVARRVAGVLSAAVAVWALWVLVGHELAVDRCLDGGGSFNYVQGVCDASANHPALSL